MKITPNHISLLLSREGSSVLVLAERKNETQWLLQKQNEDRKDTFTEAVLQQSIDKGDLKVKHFQMKPDVINMTVEVDTSYAVSQLAELEEQMEKTAAAGRAMLVVLAALDGNFAMCDVRLKANELIQQEAANRAMSDAALAARIDALESATVNLTIEEPISDGLRASTPYTINDAVNNTPPFKSIKFGVRVFTADDFRFAKTADIDGKVWSRGAIGDYFVHDGYSHTDQSIAKAVNGAKDVQTTGFPPIEIYDYLTAKYAKVCEDVTELSQAVSKCEEHLAQTRGQYNAACDTREMIYAELQKVHGLL